MIRATEVIVEYWRDDKWNLCYEAACDRIVINTGATPSTADIMIVGQSWDALGNLRMNDLIIVRTATENRADSTILFYGTLTARNSRWAGDSGGGGGMEEPRWFAQCMKQAMAKQMIFYGQIVYARSAYHDELAQWATGPATIKYPEKILAARGRRCIFNENNKAGNAKPNKDPIKTKNQAGFETNIFGYLNATYWTAKEIIIYLLTVGTNPITQAWYVPFIDPNNTIGLSDTAWDTVLNHVVIEGLDLMGALEYVANRIGWKYRLDWYYDSAFADIVPVFVFYDPGVAVANAVRSETAPCVLHKLYSPTSVDDLSTIIDKPLIVAGSIIEDSGPVVNHSIALGDRQIYEFTAELVPGWKDADLDLTVTTADKIYYSDNEIEDLVKTGVDPLTKSYYIRHHANGTSFSQYKDVGRKWALNEIGSYSLTAYGRGKPFDFSTKIPGAISDLVGFFPRSIIDTVTTDGNGNTVGYYLEFSVDGGVTWHVLDCRVELLENEWGIYISEPNLSEIKPYKKTTEGTNQIYSGTGANTTDAMDINYWTSIYRDKEKSRTFQVGTTTGVTWKTRVRLTASVQFENRLYYEHIMNDSPIDVIQKQVYDWARNYSYKERLASSKFNGDSYFTNGAIDDTVELMAAQAQVDSVNQRLVTSSQFDLSKIFYSPGNEDDKWKRPLFMVGDCISEIVGRDVQLNIGAGKYAYIEQVQYMPEICAMALVMSDLRLSRVG